MEDGQRASPGVTIAGVYKISWFALEFLPAKRNFYSNFTLKPVHTYR